MFKLETQTGSLFCTGFEEVVDENACIIDEDIKGDDLLENLANSIWFDTTSNSFFYHEVIDKRTDFNQDTNTSKWRVNDSKWCFGPNRGGCEMRVLRNFKKKNGKISKDCAYIAVGEYPVFNTSSSVPIAKPIIPTNLRTDSNFKKNNYFNSYNYEAPANTNPSHVSSFTCDGPLVKEDCINYLKFVYYAQLQNTDETN
jgi:hypothetical protein